MLHGREAERTAVEALLEDARAGHSGMLVLRGEPGMGKTALLRHARELAGDMRVLQASGVESEAELAFAGLHQLLRPLLPVLDRLPEPQAMALRGALGLSHERTDDRFLISLAVLGLLAEAAEDRPLLVLLDDAHWLDGPSEDALAFAARRLDAEGVAFVITTRRAVGTRYDGSLPALTLGPLSDDAALALLADGAGGNVAADVASRLLRSAGGHPLALAELPAHLTAAQLAGHAPLPAQLPLGEGLERALLDRVHRLPEPAQALLTVAAADDAGDVHAITACAASLGLDPGALDALERSGLVELDDGALRFQHPLVRSAVYGAVPPHERRRIHAALAGVLGDEQPDRRAWHLAAAATGPDEAVADALERTAERANARGGPAAAAVALERAAALSEAAEARTRRLVAAARAGWTAGRPELASDCLTAIEGLPLTPETAADAAFVRGMIEFNTGEPARAAVELREAAEAAQASDFARSLTLRVAAMEAGAMAGERPSDASRNMPVALDPDAVPDERERFLSHLLLGLRVVEGEDTAAAAGHLRSALALGEGFRDPRLVRLAGVAAVYLGQERRARAMFERAVAMSRATGSLGTLPVALHTLAASEIWAGRAAAAEAAASEGLELARMTRQENIVALNHSVLCRAAAMHGREEACREHAEACWSLAVPRGLEFANAAATYGIGELELSLGRAEEALDRFDVLVSGPTGHHAYRLLSVPSLIEAAVRAGAHERGRAALAFFERWAQEARSVVALALALRSRALLSTGDEAGRYFEDALARHGEQPQPFDRARTQLLYGEHLRRERQRGDARTHLRSALHAFEGAGAAIWAERARQELRATGESARRRDPATILELTPQELRIARLVSAGASNRDVATQLFLSPRTVEYHLAKVFSKLGLTSRGQLATAPLGVEGG
jgi:DNA-binding CsgD family transcriptional regulator